MPEATENSVSLQAGDVITAPNMHNMIIREKNGILIGTMFEVSILKDGVFGNDLVVSLKEFAECPLNEILESHSNITLLGNILKGDLTELFKPIAKVKGKR